MTLGSSYSQAIMMSICLQSMVDELMVKKSGGSIRKVSNKQELISSMIVLFLPSLQKEAK